MLDLHFAIHRLVESDIAMGKERIVYVMKSVKRLGPFSLLMNKSLKKGKGVNLNLLGSTSVMQ